MSLLQLLYQVTMDLALKTLAPTRQGLGNRPGPTDFNTVWPWSDQGRRASAGWVRA